MNEIIHEYYLESGRVAARVRKETISRIKKDVQLLEIAEFAENRIRELGAKPAFPCNISINEIASHYTPEDGLPCFKEGDVVKIDIGAHIEGFIADTAATVEIGTNNHRRLILACDEALGNAIASIKDNVQTRSIGKIIENTIKKHGFNPVRDLTGHSLEQYQLHAGITIPNYGGLASQKITKDMVFAIEPFATYGKGSIKYGRPYIYALKRNRSSKTHLKIQDMFGPLPFAPRWIPGINLKYLKDLHEYLEIIEADNKIVVQSEHTVIVYEEGCEVITR